MKKAQPTLRAQITEIKSNELSYRTLHDTATILDENSGRNIEIPFRSITNKYRNFLSNIVITMNLTEAEALKYRYNPKLLSYDLYGTTEYWDDILILNNYSSILQFTPTNTVKVYNKRRLKEYLNEIMILENLI